MIFHDNSRRTFFRQMYHMIRSQTQAYDTCPSTEKQLLLANELKRELEEMGASDVRMSGYGYLFARIPDNTGSTSAHDASGVGQKATIPALGFTFPTWTPRRP